LSGYIFYDVAGINKDSKKNEDLETKDLLCLASRGNTYFEAEKESPLLSLNRPKGKFITKNNQIFA